MQTNIYDTNIYFAITFNNEISYILEPMGWDKISCRISRDPNYFGFWSDFLEDKYGMLFTFIKAENGLTGGAQILKDIYETKGEGANAKVIFSIGVMNYNTPQEINNWRINLNEYVCDFGGVSTSIEKMPFQGKLRARMSAPCTINDHVTMDGELLTQIPTWQARLHSKTLLEQSQFASPTLQISRDSLQLLDIYFILQPDQSNAVSNELSVFTQPMDLIDTGSNNPLESGTPASAAIAGLDKLPFTDLISQYNPTVAGTLKIEFSGSSDFYFYNFGGHTWWEITWRVVIQRYINGVLTVLPVTFVGTPFTLSTGIGGDPPCSSPGIGGYGFPFASINTADLAFVLPQVTGSTPRRDNVGKIQNYSFNETFTDIVVEVGDFIYVHAIMCNPFTGSSFPGQSQFVNFTSNIKYTQLTVTTGTTSDGYRIYDVVNQLIENTTGQKDAISTSFFDQQPSAFSFGAKYLLMNGYSIRNFGANIYQPKLTLQFALDSLNALFCNGFGIKRNIVSGVERLAISYISDFFKTLTIFRFEDTFEWKDNFSVKNIFNKIELGYEKFEGLNIIQQDEFNTSGSYLLQFLKYGDKTLSKKCGFIASGYLIEEQRRNQFLSNPGQSLSNDNDIFIIATNEPCIFNSIFTSFFNNAYYGFPGLTLYYVSFQQTSMSLKRGDTFTTSSGANAGSVFTIYQELQGYPRIDQDFYYILEIPTPETINTDLTITPPSPNQVFAERNQPFEICSGCIDPSTIYNARLSLKHIRANWRPYIGVSLDQVDTGSQDFASSQIVTTLVKMNSLLTTKYLSTEQFKGNVGDQTLNEFNRDFIKDYLKVGSNLFSSTGSECKLRIGWNDFNTLRHALCGELDDSVNYGGLELKDDFGQFWFCHVMDMNYELKSEILTLQVMKVSKVI